MRPYRLLSPCWLLHAIRVLAGLSIMGPSTRLVAQQTAPARPQDPVPNVCESGSLTPSAPVAPRVVIRGFTIPEIPVGGVGYLGLTMSGTQLRTVHPLAGILTNHCEYPMVESVELHSPAAQAGVAAGDTVVAYNGRDLRRWAVNYPWLLVPGDTVRVRIRRSGKQSEFPMIVAVRPVRQGVLWIRGDSAAVRAVDGNGRPFPPLMLIPRPEANALTSFAGAEFASVDDAFLTNLGMKPGVLVLRVPPGTPAAEAGIRSGDVVRRVNDLPVRDALVLRRLLVSTSDEVRLDVQSRGEKERVVVLPRR